MQLHSYTDRHQLQVKWNTCLAICFRAAVILPDVSSCLSNNEKGFFQHSALHVKVNSK